MSNTVDHRVKRWDFNKAESDNKSQYTCLNNNWFSGNVTTIKSLLFDEAAKDERLVLKDCLQKPNILHAGTQTLVGSDAGIGGSTSLGGQRAGVLFIWQMTEMTEKNYANMWKRE